MMLTKKGFHKGINLGGWMSQCDYSQNTLDTFITEPDFRQIADWGFDHVRIPVDYNLFQQAGGSFLTVGFQYLDQQTSIWAVCASYGIGGGEDLEAVEIKDQDGKLLETITDSAALSDFIDKFLKLGEDIGENGIAQAYFDAYTAEFGETDQIWFEDGTVKAANDAVYQEAMKFWTKDLRLVTIKLKNGYQLRDCIYAPVPGTFSIYGDYKITEPLF